MELNLGARDIRGGGTCLAGIRGDFLEEAASVSAMRMEKAFRGGHCERGQVQGAWENWEKELCAEEGVVWSWASS